MKASIFRRVAAALICICLVTVAAPAARAAEETVNILLIGLDGREGLSGSRSDTVILCSFNPGSRTLSLVSFLRDLYLPIPGRGSDRLNAAYAYGGSTLLRQTLEENFGLDIDGYVEVDFNRFAQIIDALGGVSMSLRADEAKTINEYCPGSSLTQGEHILTGQQALCYSRIRDLDPDGDFSRTRRQRALLQAMLNSWLSADLSAMVGTMRKLLPMVATDLSPVQLLDWIFSAEPARKELKLKSLQIPRQDLCHDETIRKMAVIVCDIEKNRQYLQEQLLGP